MSQSDTDEPIMGHDLISRAWRQLTSICDSNLKLMGSDNAFGEILHKRTKARIYLGSSNVLGKLVFDLKSKAFFRFNRTDETKKKEKDKCSPLLDLRLNFLSQMTYKFSRLKLREIIIL